MKPKSKFLRSLIKNLNLSIFANNSNFDQIEITELEEKYRKSRRDFIVKSSQAAILLGATSIIPLSCINSSNKKTKNKQPKIAIIGGGIAGLYAAYLLQKSGINAQIYEADKRVGGRMITQSNILGDGITTELGGEFVDSIMGDIISLCSEFKINLLNIYEDCEKNKLIRETYFLNNKHYSEKDVFNEFKKIAKFIENDKNLCGQNTDTEHAKQLDNISLGNYIDSLKCSKWLKEILIIAFTTEYGLPVSEQSSLNFVTMIGTEIEPENEFKIFGSSDEKFKIEGGSQKLIDALENKLSTNIFKEHRLNSIKSSGKIITLKFSNQKEIQVDYAIVTIPYSVLRTLELNIEGISKEKLECINTIGYGQNNKILIGFNNRPWSNGKIKYSGYMFNPIINNGWDNTQMQNNDGPAGYTMFLGGKQSIDFAIQAKNNNLKDSIPDDELQKYIIELDKAYPGAKANYNGKSKAVYWSNNPNTLGSYSCFKVGQWTTIASKIFEPVGNIHFAGEHTSASFQGFMNGGAETGRRAVEDILDKLKIKS